MKLNHKTLSAAVVMLPLVLLAVTSCSVRSEDTASTTEDAPRAQTATDNTSAAAVAPDPAFDALLPILQQMTTAPIMLPASLPPKIKSVAIEQDPNENPYTTGGDKYTILFLHSEQDSNQIVRPYVHYTTQGRLNASPASAPPPDPTNNLGTPYQLEDVTLPDGTLAGLKRLEPPYGANYGPFTTGTFEEEGEIYTVTIENDSPDGDLTRQILSTMVRVPRA